MFADFEPSVRHIVAQPFFLRATVDQKVCKHVPDHLLITDEALSLWMSSLSVAMADPKVAFTLEWTREVVEARGWRYEVATEPSAVELGNVRFLRLEAAHKISHPFAGSERRWDPYWLQVRRGKTDYNTEETKWWSVR